MMRQTLRFLQPLALVLAAWLVSASLARAEALIVTLSDRTVDITSNFNGSAITLFGAVRRDAATVPRASGYDVVVTVTGPLSDLVARQKDQVLGIWINRYARTFNDVPSAYSVLSNRPVQEIAHPSVLQRFRIGVDHLLAEPLTEAQAPGPDVEAASLEEAAQSAQDTHSAQGDVGSNQPADHVFERAFLRLQRSQRTYLEDASAVTILDDTLFRARATFPADVPLGDFTVRVFLFSGGVLLAQEEVAILVRKTGFEQVLFAASQNRPLLYGLLCVLLALATGWLGGVVFRRS
jgi:hypothetical protein